MQRGGAAAGCGKAQFKGAFYGGQQPPAGLEARMLYNKRRYGRLCVFCFLYCSECGWSVMESASHVCSLPSLPPALRFTTCLLPFHAHPLHTLTFTYLPASSQQAVA